MPAQIRITVGVAQVLREFLVDPSRPRYGYDLMQATGFASGKLYPILARLCHAGWLIRSAEDIDPSGEGRPTRYMYQLSGQGAEQARLELAALRSALAVPDRRALRAQPDGGAA
jgi:PadR family transcriptional regulator, regulatory protein PadR